MGGENFSGVGAKVDSRRVLRVGGHAFTIDAGINVFLRQSPAQGFPRFAGVAAAEYAQLVFRGTSEFRAFERDDINRFRVARMQGEWKTEIGGKPGGDFLPTPA